jgi:hypothetical protein
MPKKHNKKQTQRPMGSSVMRQFNPVNSVNHIVNQRLALAGTVSSNVVGAITQTIDFRPDSTTDWTSLANLYDEFRVVAVRLSIIPYQQGSVTALNGTVALVFDDNENGALGSLNAALDAENCHILPAIWYADQARVEHFNYARPDAGKGTSIPWQATSTPAACLGAAKMYSSTLTNSTQYFTTVMEYFVQFRLRR